MPQTKTSSALLHAASLLSGPMEKTAFFPAGFGTAFGGAFKSAIGAGKNMVQGAVKPLADRLATD